MYTWKGRECERAYFIPKDPMTPAQMAHRQVFGAMSSLGAAMLQIAKIGLRGIAAERQTTEKNVFVRMNKQSVRLVDGEVVIDYPNLQVADGPLAPVAFGAPATDDGRLVRATFTNTGDPAGYRFDYVILAAYVPQKRNCALSQPVYRSTGMAELLLPQVWTGCEAHIYGFCWDGDSNASPSCYLGTVNTAQ